MELNFSSKLSSNFLNLKSINFSKSKKSCLVRKDNDDWLKWSYSEFGGGWDKFSSIDHGSKSRSQLDDWASGHVFGASRFSMFSVEQMFVGIWSKFRFGLYSQTSKWDSNSFNLETFEQPLKKIINKN